MAEPRAALESLLAEIQAEFPRFRIVPKRGHALSRLIDVALKVLTLGQMREYMTHYHTVIFDTLYVPEGWEETPPLRKTVTLRHERVHLRQRRRYGTIGMILWYGFPILPLGLAWGRARIEWEAYAETIRATAELMGEEAARSPALRAHIVRQFTSASYGWMWPFPRTVNRWYDSALEVIFGEGRGGRAPSMQGKA